MRPEGHDDEEDNNELFDDIPETFLLCALHQAKIICERWKYWSGTVPVDVRIRLHRLESMISMNESNREKNLTIDEDQSVIVPAQNFDSSQPFLAEIRSYPTLERYYTEPQHQIVLQGPDRRRIVEEKRRVHFWCCY